MICPWKLWQLVFVCMVQSEGTLLDRMYHITKWEVIFLSRYPFWRLTAHFRRIKIVFRFSSSGQVSKYDNKSSQIDESKDDTHRQPCSNKSQRSKPSTPSEKMIGQSAGGIEVKQQRFRDPSSSCEDLVFPFDSETANTREQCSPMHQCTTNLLFFS